jgi:hypothetical protein
MSFSKKGDLIMFFHVGGIRMQNVNNLYQTGPIAEKESIDTIKEMSSRVGLDICKTEKKHH